MPVGEGVLFERGRQRKKRYLAAIDSPSVKTVADRYKQVTYHNKHWTRTF